MVSRAKDTHTPNRVVRVEESLWREYGEACAADGATRSDDIRGHMERKVRAWKRKGKPPRPSSS